MPRGNVARAPPDSNYINGHLIERFGKRKHVVREPRAALQAPPGPAMRLTTSIRKYFKVANTEGPSSWTNLPEFPVASEVFDEGRARHDEDVELEPNVIVGPYQSKEDYLSTHYALLREDAISPLRDVISEVQDSPYILERDSENDSHIYEKVYITGYTFANSGLAARITFSLGRVGKMVSWDQSKRLRTGTLVCLTPANAIFKSVARVAVVAARPLAGLQENPPSIDIFFASADEIEIDSQQEWLMVESRNGFYEGHRHVMKGLQMLNQEPFPLAEHIVDLEREIVAPEYVFKQPVRDCSSLYPNTEANVQSVNIIEGLPDLPCALDNTQKDALHRILAKKLSIIQGPPGTGKTHVSVVALKLMLHQMSPDDPPIVIASHTNHALDQLLRHVSHFEPDFLRIGGMSTDPDIIKPRTLYEIKLGVKFKDPPGSLRAPAMKTLYKLTKEMKGLLEPLTMGKALMSPHLLEQFNIITYSQCQSLTEGAKDMFDSDTNTDGEMAAWLGREKVEANLRITPEDFGIEFEEPDLEFEQIRELEAENKILDDDDDPETLRGLRIDFHEKWTGRKARAVSDKTVLDQLKKRDFYDIPDEYRGPVYIRLQKRLKESIRDQVRERARQYAQAAQDAKIGRWETDHNFLKQSRIIGMTTSGLAKYRGLLQSVDPKVVLIEEAAETIEAYASVACLPSLEHLVLVGDHQQLRGHCHVQEMEKEPFYLDVSMFERLVRNNVGFSQLKIQRRMIPEIRRALAPIYRDLSDHESVSDRSPIIGMGDINTWFFTHEAPEANDSQMSKTNEEEADMIVGFFNYLNQNGQEPLSVTVLTFYNGQRKMILRKLREHPNMSGQRFKVVTVDSYQGEENDIVILSLVRHNEGNNIGFLSVENRICVALSRAQRGFYIFGDGVGLCKSSMLWWEIVQIMAKNPRRVGFNLPLTCKKHGNVTFIRDSDQFSKHDGGCELPCSENLPCGHRCKLKCHSYSHEYLECSKSCMRVLLCGHPCTRSCSDKCKSICDCEIQAEVVGVKPPINYAKAHLDRKVMEVTGSPETISSPPWPLLDNSATKGQQVQSRNAISDYANGGHVQDDQILAKLAEQQAHKVRLKRLDDENAASLFGSDDDEVLAAEASNMTIVHTKEGKNGGKRHVWKGTHNPSRPGHRRQKESSLLD